MEKTVCIQCLCCGQIIAGDKPENLQKVCLDCCDRMKTDTTNPADTPFVIFTANVPIIPRPCKKRYNDVTDAMKKYCNETE